jgi:DNA-3-methyladenine glycosylase II
MRISVHEPFDFARTLRFILSPPALLNGRRFEPLLDHFEAGEYRRAVDINGQPVLYGVREATEPAGARGRTCGAALEVRILAGRSDALTLRAVANLVKRQFSADLDLSPFHRLASADPALASLVQRFNGMRVPQAPAVYETLISAILEQQVNLSFAHQLKKALIDAYGSAIEFEGRLYHTFPEPARLVLATPRDMRQLKISGPKARYILGLSRKALDGSLDLEALRAIEPAQAHERLLLEKGVGRWTAQYAGLRALGHLDCLPSGDVGLQRAVQRFYGLRKRPKPPRVEAIARAWAGWRSYATFYLWLTFWEEPKAVEQMAAEIAVERRRLRLAERLAVKIKQRPGARRSAMAARR